MVREQKAAVTSPLSQESQSMSSQESSSQDVVDLLADSSDLQNTQVAPPTPVFGRPTQLGGTSSPVAKDISNTSQHRVIKRSNGSSYDTLFAGSKPNVPVYHKPTVKGNPLTMLDRPKQQVQQPQPRESIDLDRHLAHKKAEPPLRNDAPFIPQNPVQIWQPRPQPTFSMQKQPSFTVRAPIAQPLSFRDHDEGDGFDDRQVFGNDRFGTTDPMLYIDSAKANDDIKALLEGAMDDEDDQRKTRRRKKVLDQAVDSLTDKLKSTEITETKANEEVEEEDDGTRPGLKVKLLPHQIEGVQWMKNKELSTKKVKGILPKGGILADDMGLGKTIQSIALILENPRPTAEQMEKQRVKIESTIGKTTLVVAPLALIKQWEAEIADRVEESHRLSVRVHHGPSRTKSYKDLQKYDVVITTYQTLTSEHAEGTSTIKTALFGVNWYRIILDEAHSIKNRNAKATKAACALNAEYRWCLSGTPMQNNLDELQSLIHFLRIKPYANLEIWREQITKPMNNGRGGLSIRRLRAFLSAFMKRRTKDVLKQPEPSATGEDKEAAAKKNGFKIVNRTVLNVRAEFSPHERAFYKRLEDRTDKSLQVMMAGGQVSYASALVLLLRLRQACNHPHLLGVDLAKEQAALDGTRTPGRKASRDDEMNDIANMLGGLSVVSQKCDICQIDLSRQDKEAGQTRCAECEADLEAVDAQIASKTDKKRKEVKASRRPVVLDSDDEKTDDDSDEESAESEKDISKADPLSSTKIRHLIRILQQDSHTHKYIVFSFFTSMLDLIEPFLRRHQLKYTRYDGSMKNDLREASLHSLRADPSTRIMLCSLKAGSLGLNLTCASRVVILEPFWNPFVEEQAIDRVHRLNQTEDVVVHKLTISDSVEERILELQEKKRELANATIEGGKMQGGKLTMQEMLNLFRHDAVKDAKLDTIGMKDGRGVLNRLDRDSESTWGDDERRKGGREQNGSRARAEDPIYGRR